MKWACFSRLRGKNGMASAARVARRFSFGLAGSSLATVTGFGLRLAAVTESGHESGLVWLQLQGLAPDLSDL